MVISEVVRIRPREAADLPALGVALLEQQPETHYPFRNPLPMPVEDFLHARDALSAWTAELGGRPVGHACRVGAARGFPEAELLNDVCAGAYGCAAGDLTWVSSLFVGADARGRGAGRRLLETVVEDARANGMRPCLEVLPLHPAAIALYLSSGWQVVHRFRPAWLQGPAGDQAPHVQVMVHVGAS